MSKTLNFTEFYDKTASIITNTFAVAGDMGLTTSPTVKVASLAINLQVNDGIKNEFIGGLPMNTTHVAFCATEQSISNGDLLLYNGVYYEIYSYDWVSSHLGSYFVMQLQTIRQ